MTELHQRVRAYLTVTFHFSDDQIDQMLPGFFDTLRDHVATLEQAIGGEAGQLARAAHTLKGALLNLGLEPEAAIALELEELGNAGGADPASLTLLVRRLRDHLAMAGL